VKAEYRTSLGDPAEETLTRNIWDEFLTFSSTVMHGNIITNKGVWCVVLGIGSRGPVVGDVSSGFIPQNRHHLMGKAGDPIVMGG
jgi:hypothetical protein